MVGDFTFFISITSLKKWYKILKPPANIANLSNMKISLCLRKIHQQAYNTNKIPDSKKITMSITFELHWPSIISGKRLTKISLIIGTIKKGFKKQSYLNCLTNISHTLPSIVKEKRQGTLRRCWGKLEGFKLIEPTSSQPTSKL
jgi:hypothetical protein